MDTGRLVAIGAALAFTPAGGPGRATQTLSILGWKTAFQGFNLGGSAALGVVMLVITLICAQIVFNRFLRVRE